jgi:hypothetical protein
MSRACLAALVLVGGALACAESKAHGPAVPPWGRLEIREILLEPPRHWVGATTCDATPTPWRFPGFAPTAIAALLREAGLGEADVQRVVDTVRCPAPGDCQAAPPADVVTGLAPGVHAALYDRLGRWPANEFAAPPFALPTSHRDWWLKAAELTPALQELVARLVYERDGFLFFGDMPTLCAAARDDDERVGVVRTFWRVPSLMPMLRLDRDTDVNRIAEWWENRQRRKSVRTLLGSLVPSEGEIVVDLVHLLPPIPRKLLYTYPPPGSPRWDCAWTAVNFFLEHTDDRFLDPDRVRDFFQERTDEVKGSELQFGDYVLFAEPDLRVHHFAVALTPELMFTKNGVLGFQPWRIASLDELKRAYARAPVLQVRRLR